MPEIGNVKQLKNKSHQWMHDGQIENKIFLLLCIVLNKSNGITIDVI